MNFFIGLLALLGLIPGLLGVFVLWHIFRPQEQPADSSNRINKIRLVWFALTREELFVDVFPWLQKDEMDNLENKDDPKSSYHETYGLVSYDSIGDFIPLPITITVNSEFQKSQLIAALHYLHNGDIDTNLVMVNELVHMYQMPDLIKVVEPAKAA